MNLGQSIRWMILVSITVALCFITRAGTADSAPGQSFESLFQVVQPPSTSESLEVDVTETPASTSRESAIAKLRLSGQALDACSGIPGRPVDIIFVFDVSASAGTGPGSNWEQTVSLADVLLTYLDRDVYRTATAGAEKSAVALVSSQTGTLGPEPVLHQELTKDYQLLHSQLGTLLPQGDTDLAAGIRMALEELRDAQADRAQAIALLLHDNTALDESLARAVDEAEDERIPVYLIANDQNISEEKQITRDIARELVPDDHIYLNPTPDALLNLFIDSSQGDQGLAAAKVVVQVTVPAGAGDIQITQGSGRAEAEQAVWEIDELVFDDIVEVGYNLLLNEDMANDVTVSTRLTWLDCNGYPQSLDLGGELNVPEPQGPSDEEISETDERQDLDGDTPNDESPNHQDPGDSQGRDSPEQIGELLEPPGLDRPDVTLPGGFLPSLSALLGTIPSWIWWVLLVLLLLLLLALLLRWLRRPRPTAGPGRPQRRAETPARPTERKPRRSDRAALDTDWREPRSARDRYGKVLVVRVRPPAQVVEESLASNKNVRLTVRVDEGDVEVGRAEAELDTVVESDPFADKTDRWRRAQLVHADLLAGKEESREISSIALGQLESLLRTHEVREIMGVLKSPDSESFYTRHGYGVRSVSEGGYRLSKSLQ